MAPLHAVHVDCGAPVRYRDGVCTRCGFVVDMQSISLIAAPATRARPLTGIRWAVVVMSLLLMVTATLAARPLTGLIGLLNFAWIVWRWPARSA